MKEWLLSLHPALLAVIATLGLALGFFAKAQFNKRPKYSLLWCFWSLVAGLGFGVGFGLSLRLLFLLFG